MTEHAQILINSFVVGLSGAMMPGPLFTMNIARTPKEGPLTGTLLAVGHSLVEFFMVIALSLGLALFVRESPIVSRSIAILGGVGLLYMAFGMFVKLRRSNGTEITTAHGAESARSSAWKLIGAGAVTTLSSPFWFMWWIMIGSAFLLTSLDAGYLGPPAFYIGHILSDLLWYTLVALLVWQGRSIFAGLGYKILLGACALFLVWLGCFFIHSGWTNAINTAFK